MVKELVGRGVLGYEMADGVTVAATSR